MQSKATRQSRNANADEKEHMRWIKERSICAACHKATPVICHHCEGSKYKVKVNYITVLIGHAFVIGLCKECDDIVTNGSRKAFTEIYGPQSHLWWDQYSCSPVEFSGEVVEGIMYSGR